MLNRMKSATVLTALCLLVLFSLGGCKSDSNPTTTDDGGSGGTDVIDISGDWAIEEDGDATACGEGLYQDSYTATIVQTGNTFVAVTSFGQFLGTVDGTTITWQGTFLEDDGSTTIDSTNLSISTDGRSLTGTINWTFTPFGGGASCSGTSTMNGTNTPNSETDVSGAWTITENVNAAACGVDNYVDVYNITVVQTGTAITVTAPAGVFQGVISGTGMNWSGSYAEDDGVVSTTLNVVIGGNGTTLTGSAAWTWVANQGDTSCSGSSQVTGIKQ